MAKTPASTFSGTASGASGSRGCGPTACIFFDLTFLGERVRVSQALSLVMIVLTAVILLKNRSADPARMFVNRRLDGQATVLPDRSEERPIEDGPAEADRPAKASAEDAAGGEVSAEGAAEPADGGDNG